MTSVDPDLLAILVCPRTRKPLRLAEPDLLARLNRAIQEGGLKNAGGAQVAEPIEAALVVEGEPWAYPIRDQIPILLIEEALPL